MIKKENYPILEFDDSSIAVIDVKKNINLMNRYLASVFCLFSEKP